MMRSLVLAFVAVTVSADLASGEDWGSLKGRIVFTGDVAKPEKLEVTRDEDVCGRKPLFDESLLVNPDNQGLANVVIWLATKGDIPVHPSFPQEPKPAKIDNLGCRFEPHIVKLQTGQKLLATSTDPVSHNIAVYARRNTPFSEIIPANSPLEKTFSRSEISPIRVDCSIHAWMRAYFIITDHPYSVVTDKDGRFEMKNVPYGDWTFRVWHERNGYLPELQIEDKTLELTSGRWEIKIAKPETEFSAIRVNRLEDE